MKLRSFFFALVALVSLPAAQAADASRTSFDRATAQLAAQLALGAVEEQSFDVADADAAPLASAISADPAAHRTAAASRAALEPTYREARAARFAADARALLARLAAESGSESPDAFFGADFTEKSTTADARRLSAAVKRDFPALFKSAREDVCAAQRRELVANVAPSVEDVDQLGRGDLERLVETRVLAQQKSPVFEENLPWLSETWIRPVVDAAYRERDAQNALLENEPTACVTPTGIAADLSRALAVHVKAEHDARTALGQPSWDVFPSVEKKRAETARRRAVDSLVRAVDALNTQPDADSLRRELRTNPVAHRTRNASMDSMRPAFEALLREALASTTETRAPANERDGVRAWVQEAVALANVKDKLTCRANALLAPALEPIRNEIAQEQFAAFTPQLAAGDWVAPMDFAEASCRSRIGIEGVARDWRASTLTMLANPPSSLFEETDDLVRRALLRSLEKARDARSRQLALVDDAFAPVRTEFLAVASKAVADGGAPIPTREEITKRLTDDTRTAWDAETGAAVYPEFFPAASERIELLAKSLFEELEKAREEANQPPTPEPPEPKPEEPQEPQPEEPEPPEELIEISLLLEVRSGRERFDIGIATEEGERIATATCSAERKSFSREAKNAARELSEKTSAWLRAKGGVGIRISAKALVKACDQFVYVGLVDALEDAFTETAADLEESGISLTCETPKKK